MAKPKARNPEEVKRNILEIASEEFAENGFAGARVNVIAERTETSKRMIYYYFEDKLGLYREVLVLAYTQMREQEAAYNDAPKSATEALCNFVRQTFMDRIRHEGFMRLVAIENIHRAENLDALGERFSDVNKSAVETIAKLYREGVASGEFRSGCDATELHWFISALATFNVTNRHTFSAAFGSAVYSKKGQENLCQMAVDAVLHLARTGRDHQ